MTDKPVGWKLANLLAALAIVLLGVIYVGKTWSPSSYGFVLVNLLGNQEGKPDWGKPRPIRSDEWAVVTPLTQATINNGFERYNKTSLYGEDLRINYGMPIHDWGLIFKPTMWLYGVVNPAYAYSAHWFAIAVMFIVGYAWLFRWLGATPLVGFALAAGLYYTGYAQFWWNEKGPLFAFFPWVILPFSTRLPLPAKAALFYWAAASWLLTNLYPPVQISLAFVGLLLVLAKEPQLFRPKPLLIVGIAAGLAAGTAALYLWDYLQATKTTLYPGGRNVGGGNAFAAWQFPLSWLLPAVNFDRRYESLIGQNICEIGTVGLYYFLLVFCFLDYSKWQVLRSRPEEYRVVKVLGVGLLMMLAWMALPLPPWVGKILLWNNVQPSRMQFAGGVTLAFLLFALVRSMGLKLTFPRLAIFCVIAAGGWFLVKYDPARKDFEDLGILILVPIAFAFGWKWPARAHASLAVVSLVAGLSLFGRFNPLQPAWPIFNLKPTPTMEALNDLVRDNGGILSVPHIPGAVANGLGFRSVSHVTAVPQLEFWCKQFPDLPPDEFNQIFNRYSHINPRAQDKPGLIQADLVSVPVTLAQKPPPVRFTDGPAANLEKAGYIDSAVSKGDLLEINGWATWSGPTTNHALEISMQPQAAGKPVYSVLMRPDLPLNTKGKLSAANGFSLGIPIPAGSEHVAICIVAYDALSGKRWLLQNPANLPYCPRQQSMMADGSIYK